VRTFFFALTSELLSISASKISRRPFCAAMKSGDAPSCGDGDRERVARRRMKAPASE
jgi:hypothetical protein